MKTMIYVLLDGSGSMGMRVNDVIGGVNKFLADQKTESPEDAFIAIAQFDAVANDRLDLRRFRAMGPLKDCKDITDGEYGARGGTPLLDAIGQSIGQLESDWKAVQPERCIMLIATDGEENASKEYTKAKIKELIEARQASGKWTFIYLGANVDAFAVGGSLGIARANTAGYSTSTREGFRGMTANASMAVKHMRSTGLNTASNLGRVIGDDEEDEAAIKAKLGGGIGAGSSNIGGGNPTPPPSVSAWKAPEPTKPWTPPQ